MSAQTLRMSPFWAGPSGASGCPSFPHSVKNVDVYLDSWPTLKLQKQDLYSRSLKTLDTSRICVGLYSSLFLCLLDKEHQKPEIWLHCVQICVPCRTSWVGSKPHFSTASSICLNKPSTFKTGFPNYACRLFQWAGEVELLLKLMQNGVFNNME